MEIRTAATLVELIWQRLREPTAAPCLHRKQAGNFRSLSWRELADDVYRAVGVLGELGVQPGDRVVQLSENRYEWIVADLAIQLAGAVHVPAHASLSGPQVAHHVVDSGARLILVSTDDQLRKLAGGALPLGVRCLIYESGGATLSQHEVESWPQRLAAASLTDAARRMEHAVASADPSGLATLLYTSGTTGEPKGVMLTQGNLATNAQKTVEVFGELPGDVRLNFLPFSHIFARTCDLYTWICSGSQLALAESRETIFADCAQVHPHTLTGVPYFYERVRRTLVDRGDTGAGALRELLGGEIRYCCSGGAALPNHLYDFFLDRGVPLLQGYGLTESSPVISASSRDAHRRGAVGKALPGVEVRIADDGEILSRGPHIMAGYWNLPQATRQALVEGWLHTGDLGHLDEDGYLYITGRKKELIITSCGKNIAPVQLECLLSDDPLIHQVMVVGDGKDYLAALIVPSPESLRAEIMARGIAVTSRAEALQHPEVLALYRQRIDERLRGLSHHEQIGQFVLLERAFSLEEEEITPKLSLRRSVIEQHFADAIAQLYAPRQKSSERGSTAVAAGASRTT